MKQPQIHPGVWCFPTGGRLGYAIEVTSGVVLVDPVWTTEGEVIGDLASIGATPSDVEGILLTHIHPDSYQPGRWDAWVAAHPADAIRIPDTPAMASELSEQFSHWLATAGVPRRERTALLAQQEISGRARPDVLLVDGDRPPLPGRRVTAVHTPGHTPGHLCFHDEQHRVVFTGETVLPRGSPNISRAHDTGDNPLGDYLASLERVRAFDGAHGLPEREWPFGPVGSRAEALLSHHRARLDKARALIAAGAETVWEVAACVGWSYPWDQLHGYRRRAALGETHAYLAYLEREGTIRRIAEEPLRWTCC